MRRLGGKSAPVPQLVLLAFCFALYYYLSSAITLRDKLLFASPFIGELLSFALFNALFDVN